jgi:hypothetical protein
MLVRIDANAPREAIKMALTFAAENGFAVDFRSFGPPIKTSPKPSEKAVRQPSEKVKPAVKASKKPPVKASEKPDEALRVAAKSLREKAEKGTIKLPKEVYAALRSKDTEKLTKAIADASGILKDPAAPFESIYYKALHDRFLHENPLLDAAK